MRDLRQHTSRNFLDITALEMVRNEGSVSTSDGI
jgi:hypothetical protein